MTAVDTVGNTVAPGRVRVRDRRRRAARTARAARAAAPPAPPAGDRVAPVLSRAKVKPKTLPVDHQGDAAGDQHRVGRREAAW